MLDESEMEAGGEGDSLGVDADATGLAGIGDQVFIGSGDGGVLVDGQRWNGLRELEAGIEVRIIGVVTVPGPEAGVDGELGEIGETPGLRNAGHFAGRKGCEIFVEVDGTGALRFQIVFEERSVTEFIVGVVDDVLRHVAIQNLQPADIQRREAGGNGVAILIGQVDRGNARRAGTDAGAAEFGVLFPQIGFNRLQRLEETKNRGIASREATGSFVFPGQRGKSAAERTDARGGEPCGHRAFRKESSAAGFAAEHTVLLFHDLSPSEPVRFIRSGHTPERLVDKNSSADRRHVEWVSRRLTKKESRRPVASPRRGY